MPASIRFNKLQLNRGKERGMAEVTLHPLNHRRELPFSKHLQEQTDASPASNPRRVMKNRKKRETENVIDAGPGRNINIPFI